VNKGDGGVVVTILSVGNGNQALAGGGQVNCAVQNRGNLGFPILFNPIEFTESIGTEQKDTVLI